MSHASCSSEAWILSLDTSSAFTFLALGKLCSSTGLCSSNCFEERSSYLNDSHQEEVATLARRLLGRAKVSFSMLKGLALGAGPGSFTGLRIGNSFMKGLACALEIPIWQTSSLLAAAWEFRDPAQEVLVLADARREEFFSCQCRFFALDSYEIILPEAIRKSELLKQIISSPQAVSVAEKALKVVCMPGSERTVDAMEACGLEGSRAVPEHLASSVLQIAVASGFAEQLREAGAFNLMDLAGIAPNYQRAVAALTIEERQMGKR